MIFIKNTSIEKLKDYFDSVGYQANTEDGAYILVNEKDIQSVCTYKNKKNYVLIQKIICPSHNKVFIDAVTRALLSSKFNDGFIYAMITTDDSVVQEALTTMTQFKYILPKYEFMTQVLFDRSNINENSLYVDIFKLFMHHTCSKVKNKK
jgi:hypothetical protein